MVLRVPLLPPGRLREEGEEEEMSGFLLLCCLLVAPTGIRPSGNLKARGLNDGGG